MISPIKMCRLKSLKQLKFAARNTVDMIKKNGDSSAWWWTKDERHIGPKMHQPSFIDHFWKPHRGDFQESWNGILCKLRDFGHQTSSGLSHHFSSMATGRSFSSPSFRHTHIYCCWRILRIVGYSHYSAPMTRNSTSPWQDLWEQQDCQRLSGNSKSSKNLHLDSKET